MFLSIIFTFIVYAKLHHIFDLNLSSKCHPGCNCTLDKLLLLPVTIIFYFSEMFAGVSSPNMSQTAGIHLLGMTGVQVLIGM